MWSLAMRARDIWAGVADQVTTKMMEGIGKVPVVCNPVAGYIVPRIQALASALRSQTVRDFITRRYDGAVVPAA